MPCTVKMETKQGIIKAVEVSKGTSDIGEWTKYLFKMEDGKSYSTFDHVIGKAFKAGQSVEFTGEQVGKYWNLKTMIHVAKQNLGLEVLAPKDWNRETAAMNKNATMYTSYAKDIFVASIAEPDVILSEEEGIKVMNRAITLVKQAREAFS